MSRSDPPTQGRLAGTLALAIVATLAPPSYALDHPGAGSPVPMEGSEKRLDAELPASPGDGNGRPLPETKQPNRAEPGGASASIPWIASGLSAGLPVLCTVAAVSTGYGYAAVVSPALLGAGQVYAGDLARGSLIGLGGLSIPILSGVSSFVLVSLLGSRDQLGTVAAVSLGAGVYLASLGYFAVFSVRDAFVTAQNRNGPPGNASGTGR